MLELGLLAGRTSPVVESQGLGYDRRDEPMLVFGADYLSQIDGFAHGHCMLNSGSNGWPFYAHPRATQHRLQKRNLPLEAFPSDEIKSLIRRC